MSQRTESSELAPAFVWQLMALTLVALAFVFFSEVLILRNSRSIVSETTVLSTPWMVAQGQSLESGMLAFSGRPLQPVPAGRTVRALLGFLVIIVICPTVFLLRWRRRRISGDYWQSSSPWRISDTLAGLCTAFTWIFIIATAPVIIYGAIADQRLRTSVASAENRDAIIEDLNKIATKVAEYYILPKELAGGNHTCEGFALPLNLVSNEHASYQVTPHKGTVDLRAQSANHPTASIEATADSSGRLSRWKFKGDVW